MGYTQPTTIKLLGEHPKDKFVKVPKSLLLDGDLTTDARLVGMYLLSLKDGWEVSQRGIATALGWPRNSNRANSAMKKLVECGWVRHNKYERGNRVFKNVYVMNRDRRFNDGADDVRAADQEQPNVVDSTTFNVVDSTTPHKQLDKQFDGKRSKRVSVEHKPGKQSGACDDAGASRTEGPGIEVVQFQDGLPQKDNDSETPTVERDRCTESLTLDSSESGTPDQSSARGAPLSTANEYVACPSCGGERVAWELVRIGGMTVGCDGCRWRCLEPADPWWESAPRLTDDELGQLDLEALMRELETA